MRNTRSFLSGFNKVTPLIGIFLVATVLTGGTVASFSQPAPIVPSIPSSTSAQEFPTLFVMSSSETGIAHELSLRAVKSGEQVTKVQNFKVDLSNVLEIPLNGKLTVFTTEGIQITNVKLTNIQNQVFELTSTQNAVSFAGFPQGAYTLNVIVLKDNRQLAYEGILVIGQGVQNATALNQVIDQGTKNDVKIIFEKFSFPLPKQQPKKILDKEKICLFTPHHPICKAPPQGCPKNWGTNEDGQCFPMYRKCPLGYWRADDDETGACVPLPKQIPVSEPCGALITLACPLGPGLANPQTCAAGWHLDERNLCQPDDPSNPAPGFAALAEPGLSCQEEDDFCEPGCESSSMDCIDDVNIGDDGEDSFPEEEDLGSEEEEDSGSSEEEDSGSEEEESGAEDEAAAEDEDTGGLT